MVPSSLLPLESLALEEGSYRDSQATLWKEPRGMELQSPASGHVSEPACPPALVKSLYDCSPV